MFEQFIANRVSTAAYPAVSATTSLWSAPKKKKPVPAPPAPLEDTGQDLSQYANHQSIDVRRQAFGLMEERCRRAQTKKREKHAQSDDPDVRQTAQSMLLQQDQKKAAEALLKHTQALISKKDVEPWILDTGTSSHVTHSGLWDLDGKKESFGPPAARCSPRARGRASPPWVTSPRSCISRSRRT